MSFSILYSDVFLSEKTVEIYESGSLLDAIKTKYQLNYQDVVISSKTDNGVFEIPAKMLPYFRPKKGEYIAFIKPKDRDTARIALTIVLVAAGQGYVAGLGLGGGAVAFASAAVTVGSVYLASAIIPYKTESASAADGSELSTSSISGSGNSINKGGTVPYLIGTHKFSPPKAIQPITEYVNKTEAYLTEVFCLGYGPLIIDYDTIKLGDTKLTSFSNVEIQVKDNYKNSSPISLTSGIVDAAIVSATFTGSGDTATRTTSTNCERIDVEIGYPSLTAYNDSGNKISTSCVYRIDYREVGTSQWIGFNGSAIQDAVVANDGAVTLRLKDREYGGNDRQGYYNTTVNTSYFTFPNGIPSHITAGNGFTVYGSTYNNGYFFAYSISGNSVYVGGYTIVEFNAGRSQTAYQYGRVLTNESTLIVYSPTASPINSTDTDATAVATYRTHSLTNIKKSQYDVRITRITAEPSSTSNTRNEFQWTQLKSTQLTDSDGSTIVPFSDEYCYIGLRIKATDQLNGSINNLSLTATSVCYDYDETDGSLNGNLASGNPAWEYAKILNGSAAKQRVDLDEVDIDAFIEWGELCDEQVIGTDGVADSRFRINTVIDSATTEEDVLLKIASIGRASRRWVDFKESVIIDKSGIQPSIFLNPANIMSFKWDKSFARRADAYNMSFYNKEIDYVADELLVKIDDSVADNDLDYIEDLDATGITDPDQVYRYGKFAHAQLKLRPETYTATLGVNNLIFLRGDVIALTHDRVQGVTCFGQVLARNGLVLTVDNPFNISNDDLPLYATFSDPDAYEQAVATYTVTDITDNFITFASLPTFNVVEAYYSIGDTVSSLTRLYMVKGISSADDLTATVQLVDYASPTIYDAADSISNYETGTVDFKESEIVGPTPPVIEEIVTNESALKLNSDGSIQVRALIQLDANYVNTNRPEPTAVDVFYRVSGTNSSFQRRTFNIGEELYIDNISESLVYDFKVRYLSFYGAASVFAFSNGVEIIGKTTPPPDVIAIDYNDGMITWSYPNPPLDLEGFQVRYATGSTSIWESAVPLQNGVITTSPFDVSDFISDVKSFFVKAVDTSGNYSETAAKVVVNLGDVDYSNIVTTIDKYVDGWPDAISNGFIDGSGFLESTTYDFYGDDESLFYNASESSMFYNDRNKKMTYTFDFTPDQVDSGARLSIGIKSSIDSAYIEWVQPSNDAFYSSDSSSLFYGADDSLFYTNTADAIYDASNSTFYSDDSDLFYSSDEDSFYQQDIEATFSLFSGVVPSIKRVKYRFRVTVPENTDPSSILEYVRIVVDVDDLEDEVNNYELIGGSGRLPLSLYFRKIVNMQLTLQDDNGTASYVKIVDKDELLGPLVETYDSSGLKVTSVLDALIRGY